MLAAFDPDKEVAESECYLAGVVPRLQEAGVYARTRVEVAKPEVSIAEVAARKRLV